MKKLIISTALLTSIFAFSQEKEKDNGNVKNIDEVSMTKKVVTRKADRMVYEVAATPVAKGNTAFNVLKDTPLVSSTDDKTLKISGKSNAVIYINGKKNMMSADALEAMLKSTPAENIQRVEVITLPGSEYNVESSDGIINIVMKKKISDGVSGNLRMSNTQFKYNNQASSASINARKGKLGANASINYSDDIRLQEYQLQNGNSLLSKSNVSTGKVENRDRNFGDALNLDYALTEKQSLALSYDYWHSKTLYQTSNLFNVTRYLNAQKELQTNYTNSKNNGNDYSQNHNVNLNYEIKLDDNGSKLALNTAYLNYTKGEYNSNSTDLVTERNEFLRNLSRFNQNAPQSINSYTANADFTKVFKNFTLGLGGNYSKTKTDNDTYFEIYNQNIGSYEKDLNQSNHFIYKEDIGGLYVNIDKNFGEKIATKAGLRLETTNSNGEILGSDQTVKRNTVNFLPTLSINYNMNPNHALSYAFTSRMRRPSFWELNPVRTYLTQFNYVQNNPFMKSSSVYNQEMMYMYKNSYFLQITDSSTKDAITQVPFQKDENGVRTLRYIRTNYGTENNFAVNLGLNKAFFKGIWTVNAVAGLQVNTFNGSVDTDPITNEKFEPHVFDYTLSTPFFQTSHNIRLSPKKDWFLGVNYFYLGKSRSEFGTLTPLQQADVSLKKLWNNWTFALDVKDIFNTMEISISDEQANGNYNIVTQNQYRQRATLSITYNFGNEKIKRIRTIEKANDDIKSRTGGN